MKYIINPKNPKSKSWAFMGEIPLPNMTIFDTAQAWRHESGLCVLSAVEAPDDKIGPEYHISITKNGNQRCSSNEAKFVLKHFDMEHSDEDNHTMIARHFWMPVADNKAENYYSWPRRLINEKRQSICINSSHIINQIAKEEN